MNEHLPYFITVFMGFFAIMNPIANAPIFIGLTDGIGPGEKKKIAFKAVLVAFIIIAVFVIGGKLIFEAFGLTVPAFRITGGLVLFLVGFEMLQGKHSKVQHNMNYKEDENQSSDVAVTPLAIPILAGPGTITTAMNFVTDGSIIEISITVAVFAIMCAITYIFFVGANQVTKFLVIDMLKLISKIMGLILAVISVNMIIDGIKGAFNLTS